MKNDGYLYKIDTYLHPSISNIANRRDLQEAKLGDNKLNNWDILLISRKLIDNKELKVSFPENKKIKLGSILSAYTPTPKRLQTSFAPLMVFYQENTEILSATESGSCLVLSHNPLSSRSETEGCTYITLPLYPLQEDYPFVVLEPFAYQEKVSENNGVRFVPETLWNILVEVL